VGGDSIGGSHHLDQQFLFRPFFGWSRYRTPIAKLFVYGSATWPGTGVGAGSGWLLGRMLAGA
jgi:phytoene dehydrogenase-like protein